MSDSGEYDVGETVRMSVAVLVAGVLTVPGTITHKYLKPDGTLSTATPSNDGTGLYHRDVVVAMPGRWVVRFETTTPAGAREWSFTVKPTAF